MKKVIILSLIFITSSLISMAQDAKTPAPAQFTKAELLAFKDVKSLLSAINKGQDYSNMMVRNFNLTTNVASVNKTVVAVSEMGPGGVWSEKQKSMIEQYAKKGVVFTLEKIVMIESGKKGMIEQPNVLIMIKE